ncbi:MAG: LarC family nickel insertion protein [Treponema sp.]|nr:LarC family nickel insertion protein [Treponema sp.]
MKQTLYIDCSAGVCGDMILGALIDLGADIGFLETELRRLDMPSYRLRPERKERDGDAGVDLHVLYEGGADWTGEHPHTHGHLHHHGGHRSYRSIREMIEKGGLGGKAGDIALDIFAVIAEAEAAVHGVRPETVVFHELGRTDSIIDIAGTAICVDRLGAGGGLEILCSTLHDGKGFIDCDHGRIPVPVPAVRELLKGSGLKLISEDVNTELVTPSGLGILKGLGARCVEEMPQMDCFRTGYGFGKRQTGRFNALRMVLGLRHSANS